jgi:hypothetical protein
MGQDAQMAIIITSLAPQSALHLLIFKVKGQGHWVKFLPHNILVNTLESTFFNEF